MNFRIHPFRGCSGADGTKADPPENGSGYWRGHLRVALFGLLFFFGRLSAGATQVTFDVQPRLLNLGETAQGSLVFHGVQNAPGINFPDIPGLQITSGGQMIQNINGDVSARQNYNFFPQKAGSYTIGPYTLDYNGEQIQIPEVKLEVRAPAGSDSQSDMIFARMVLPEQAPYIHQVFDIVLSLYALPNVELTRDVNLLGGFPESGFVMGNFEELQTQREEVSGQFYTVRRFRARVRALTAGTFPLQPALRVGVVDRSQSQRRRDPFGGFFNDPFFGGPSANPLNVSIPATNLTIRSIPTAGRPADFSGAVGRFNFVVDVRPRELKVGEPITVSLRLQGAGNIAAVIPPSYRDGDTYKAYDARQVGDTPAPTDEEGAKTFEQVVIPRTENLKALPVLSFTFFDPADAQYRTVSAGPFPLTVHPAENGASSLMLQVPGAATAGGSSLVLGSDIVYLKPAPAHWQKPGNSQLTRHPLVLGLHAAAPLALAGLFFATRRRNRLAADIALARRQKAPQSARANLRKAEMALKETGAPGAVFASLAAAASDYFGHRFNLPPGAVDANLILDKLRAAKADADSLAKWQEFFALSDQIRYASSTDLSREALASWLTTLASLLRKAERIRL